MSNSVLTDLSKRLQRSLDSNYNVTDLETVFEIIKILETTPITKDQLEASLLAKYINQFRKNTTNAQLARQAKNLLKKWRDTLLPAAGGASAAAVVSSSTAPTVPLTNGTGSSTVPSSMAVRSLPTTPSQMTMAMAQQQQQQHQQPPPHHGVYLNSNSNSNTNNNNNYNHTHPDHVITIPDDDNDSGGTSKCDMVGRTTAATATTKTGAGVSIPTELTNFYMKNKQIIDIGHDVQQQQTRRNHHSQANSGSNSRTPGTPNNNNSNNNNFNHNTIESLSMPESSSMSPQAQPKLVTPPKHQQQQSQRVGRKKGAKGVDSLLGQQHHHHHHHHHHSNNSNSGFDPVASSGGGGVTKVKTTRQLVADLQIRHQKLAAYGGGGGGNDLSNDHESAAHSAISSKQSPTAASSFLPSSPSNDSHHAATTSGYELGGFRHQQQLEHDDQVATDNKIGRSKSSKRKRRDGDDSSQRKKAIKVQKVETPPPPSGMNFLNQIDEDIWQLQNRLPPIDRKAILREIKAEQAAQEAIENRCTCVLVECTEEEAGVEPSERPTITATIVSDPVPADIRPMGFHQPRSQQHQQLKSKSIFDDDDHQQISPATSSLAVNLNSTSTTDKNNNSGEESTTNPRDDRFFRRDPMQPSMLMMGPGTSSFLMQPGEEEAAALAEKKTYYKMVEDPQCRVKRRQDELVHLNEDYHLPALHQLYIPQVNGNWSEFSDLAILRTQRAREEASAKRQTAGGLPRKRVRRSSSNSSSEEEGDDDEAEDYEGAVKTTNKVTTDSDSLLKCLERLQAEERANVEAVVPLANPFFYFLKPGESTAATLPATHPGAPRHVPLRVDYGLVVVPPKEPPPPTTEEGGVPPPPPPAVPPPFEFNHEMARELGIDIREGHNQEVYDAAEIKQFLLATLKQRLPKFQMANLFYKRSWPGQEDRCQTDVSLELLNSLYLNRVLEFKRKCRRKKRRKEDNREQGLAAGGSSMIEHADQQKEADEEEEDVEERDVNQFRLFLESKANESGLTRNGPQNWRRFFYVNDDRLFGQQPSILQRLEASDPLLVADRARCWWFPAASHSSLPISPPLARECMPTYLNWAKFKWNFLLDYYQEQALADEWHDVLGCESHGSRGVGSYESRPRVVETSMAIHENNFRLPSFNQLTEENLLGLRIGRRRRCSETAENAPVGAKVKFIVESFRERDFISVCMEKWPQLFENVSFNYEDGLLVIRNVQTPERWQFVAEFKELLREVTRLGVAAEYETNDSEQLLDERTEYEEQQRNGYASWSGTRVVKVEPAGSDNDNAEGNQKDEQQQQQFEGEGDQSRGGEGQELCLFKEWHESVQVKSYNDELLTILPYVVFD